MHQYVQCQTGLSIHLSGTSLFAANLPALFCWFFTNFPIIWTYFQPYSSKPTSLCTCSTFWVKKAIIIPVFKQGVSGFVANYQPISLTNVLSKITERIISKKIVEHLLINKLVSPEQHRFLSHHSTTTNLLESLNDWTLNVNLGIQTAVIYIDFAKAFDSVSHQCSFS